MPNYELLQGQHGKKKVAHYGLKRSGKKEWCATCAERHGGVLLSKQQMCEDCHKKRANYGEEGKRSARWCGLCAKRHGGVWLGKRQMCEDCQPK